MSERNDLTPPPEEPLPGESKQAIRARLLASADQPSMSPARRWLMPALAAAAVLMIVAAGAFAVSRDDNSGGPGSPQPLAPAGSDSPVPDDITFSEPGWTYSPEPEPDYPKPHSTNYPTVTIDPTMTPDPGAVTATSCDDEIDSLHEPSLRGASVTAERDAGRGTTYLYETKSAWVVCDDTTAAPGGPQSEMGFSPTLVSFHQKSETYQPDTGTLGISENYISDINGAIGSAYFFAAGRDFDGVQAISYKFPDGHTEDAVVGQNGLWSMNYLVTDPSTVRLYAGGRQLDPIEVTVHYSPGGGGGTDTFTLQWGLNTCAQVNHGC